MLYITPPGLLILYMEAFTFDPLPISLCPTPGSYQSVLCIYKFELSGFGFVFFFSIPYINEIIQYLSFSV